MPENLGAYYTLLGVSSASSLVDIKNAYRTKARKLHPDTNKSPESTAQMQELNEAYAKLCAAFEGGGKEKRGEENRESPKEHDSPAKPEVSIFVQVENEFLEGMRRSDLTIAEAYSFVDSFLANLDRLKMLSAFDVHGLSAKFRNLEEMKQHLLTLMKRNTETSQAAQTAGNALLSYRTVHQLVLFDVLFPKINAILEENKHRTPKKASAHQSPPPETFRPKSEIDPEELAKEKEREAQRVRDEEEKRVKDEQARKEKESRKKACEDRMQDLKFAVEFTPIDQSVTKISHEFSDVLSEVFPEFTQDKEKLSVMMKQISEAKSLRKFWGREIWGTKTASEYFSQFQTAPLREALVHVYQLEMHQLYEKAVDRPFDVFKSTEDLVRFLRDDLGSIKIATAYDVVSQHNVDVSLTGTDMSERLERIAQDLFRGNMAWSEFLTKCAPHGSVYWPGMIERPSYPMYENGKVVEIKRKAIRSDKHSSRTVESQILERDFLRFTWIHLQMCGKYQDAMAMLRLLNVFSRGGPTINDIVLDSPTKPKILEQDACFKVQSFVDSLKGTFSYLKRRSFLTDNDKAIGMMVRECGILDTTCAFQFVMMIRGEITKK